MHTELNVHLVGDLLTSPREQLGGRSYMAYEGIVSCDGSPEES